MSSGGLKTRNDLKNEIEKLASKNAQLRNYYIEKQDEYGPEFELRLNRIRTLTIENKLENPDWMNQFLEKNESTQFIDPASWQTKRIAALDTVQQLLLPGLTKKD